MKDFINFFDDGIPARGYCIYQCQFTEEHKELISNNIWRVVDRNVRRVFGHINVTVGKYNYLDWKIKSYCNEKQIEDAWELL